MFEILFVELEKVCFCGAYKAAYNIEKGLCACALWIKCDANNSATCLEAYRLSENNMHFVYFEILCKKFLIACDDKI